MLLHLIGIGNHLCQSSHFSKLYIGAVSLVDHKPAKIDRIPVRLNLVSYHWKGYVIWTESSGFPWPSKSVNYRPLHLHATAGRFFRHRERWPSPGSWCRVKSLLFTSPCTADGPGSGPVPRLETVCMCEGRRTADAGRRTTTRAGRT